jgi:hypothetical protein
MICLTKEHTLGDPNFWSTVASSTDTLRPQTWIDASILDLYLLNTWFKSLSSGSHSYYFLDTTSVHSILDLDLTQQSSILSRLGLSLPCPLKPVVLLCFQHNHFWASSFDYLHNKITLYGKAIPNITLYGRESWPSTTQQWNDWIRGPILWGNIKTLFGWSQLSDLPLSTSTVSAINYPQNGYDCGITALQVIKNLLEHSNIPKSPSWCPNSIRLQVLHSTWETCTEMYTKLNLDSAISVPETSIAIAKTWPSLERKYEQTSAFLASAIECCMNCPQHTYQTQEDAPQPPSPSQQFPSSEDGIVPETRPTLPLYPYLSYFKWIDKSPPPPVLSEKTSLSLNPISDYELFDDYHFDSSWESRNRLESFESDSLPSKYIDRGWRILPSFCYMLGLHAPHPVSLSTFCYPHGLPPRHSQYSRVPESTHQNSQVTIVTMQQMLDLAGERGSQDSHKVFVCGRSPRDDTHLVLDLEDNLSQVLISPTNLDVVPDIDSVIWVGKFLQMKSDISIKTVPPVGDNTPHIKTSNFINVDLLPPPSLESGTYDSFLTSSKSLSVIPHVPIANLSSNPGLFSLFMMFPRMLSTQKSDQQSFLPYPILCHLWDQLLLPAIHMVLEEDNFPSAYAPRSVEENTRRTRTRGRLAGNPARAQGFVLSPSRFSQFQHKLNEVIAQSPGATKQFGSFFFVLEAKGIKQWTSDTDPFSKLCSAFPQFDWDYLQDRQHAELYLDIGLCIHPKSQEALVGQFRLDVVSSSMSAAGMRSGNFHHTGTLGMHGGYRTTGKSDRLFSGHIVASTSYNLSYEAVRTSLNNAIISTYSDAFNLTNSYTNEINTIIQTFEKAASQSVSYGCRQEYRLGHLAARDLLSSYPQLVSRWLESYPILWIKASTWFSFWAQRLFELKKTQITVSTMNPKNSLLITGILTTMINSVTSSPIIKGRQLASAFKSLQMPQIMKQYGWFALFDLNIHSPDMLPHIPSEDTIPLRAELQIQPPRTRGPIVYKPIQKSVFSEEFPIGDHPTWGAIKHAILMRPDDFIRPLDLKTLPEDTLVQEAVDVFIIFVQQLWQSLHSQWFIGGTYPSITTLHQALNCWSLQSVRSLLRPNCFTLLPSQAGLEGFISGAPSKTFQQRRSQYFPDPNPLKSSHYMSKPKLLHTQWAVLWLEPHGYLTQYYSAVEGLTQFKRRKFDATLDICFSYMQLLPDSKFPTDKYQGQIWKINSATHALSIASNPHFYALHGVGHKSGDRHVIRAAPASHRVHVLRALITGVKPKPAGSSRAALRRQALSRRSGKSRNKRNPPQRKVCCHYFRSSITYSLNPI